jgi:hypothetical protein
MDSEGSGVFTTTRDGGVRPRIRVSILSDSLWLRKRMSGDLEHPADRVRHFSTSSAWAHSSQRMAMRYFLHAVIMIVATGRELLVITR